MSTSKAQRFFEAVLPSKGDYVVVKITKIDSMGVFCELLEYGNAGGFIPTPELSVARIRSIAQITKVGNEEVAVVLTVDEKRGYIDLSKQRVEPQSAKNVKDRFTKEKLVHTILNDIAIGKKLPIADLYTNIAWPLARVYKNTYEAFKLALQDSQAVFKHINESEEIKSLLFSNLQRRLNPQPIKIRAEISIRCFVAPGIEAIKAALVEGERITNDGLVVECRHIASPLYFFETLSLKRDKGIALLNAAINAARISIEGAGGTLEVTKEPIVISNDEKEFGDLEAHEDEDEEEEEEEDEDNGDGDDDGDDN